MYLITRRSKAAPRSRPGFTLVELMVAVTMLAIVGGSLMAVLARQQRFHRGTADIINLRSQLRQGAALMAGDLRGLSSASATPALNDLVAITDSSIDFRYTIANSIACVIGGNTLTLPPLSLAAGNVLTSWITTPAAGDDVYVFDEGADTTKSTDDTWQLFTIASGGFNAVVGGCPTPYTTTADATSSSYTVTYAANSNSSTTRAGAAVRITRHAHYSLYQAGNGQWYLGYYSGPLSTTNTIQPVAGPFLPYVATTGTGSSGIRITYSDTLGNATTTPSAVSKISVVLRGQTSQQVKVSNVMQGLYVDSLRINVALRNRS